MFPNIHKYIYIAIGIIFVIMIGYGLYYINDLKNQRDEWKLEANKVGIALKISDSLWKYTAYINQQKMDSIIKSNKDIAQQIKQGQEKPLIVTITKEKVYVEKVPADTTKPDPTDSTYRIATAKHKDGWYDLEAKYQVIKPWGFEFTKIQLNNKRTSVITKLPNGRIAVYFKSSNPYITDDSVEAIVDPVLIQAPEKGPKWKWQLSALMNPWDKSTDLGFGIFAPFNLGVVTSYTIYNSEKVFIPSPNQSWKIGLSFIKDF